MGRLPIVDQGNGVRQRNRALSRREVGAGATRLESRPRALFIELTRYCNLSCPMCREPGMVGRGERMSEELFARVETELFPTADLIDLRGWGESLILPEFADRARRAARHGAQLRLVTNLSMRRPDVLELLAELGVHIGISIDSADPEILAQLRRGARLDRIENNARLLHRAYAERGIADRLNFYVTCQRPALPSLESLVDLAVDVGIRDIRLAPVTVAATDTGCLSLKPVEGALCRAMERTAKRGRELGARVSLTASLFDLGPPEAGSPACLHPWAWCYVAWDGRVGFCDHLIGPHGDPYILGDLNQSSFESIWNGPEWVALRAEHLGARRADAPHFEECAHCYRSRHLDIEDLLEPSLSSQRQTLAASLETLSRPGGDV